MSDKKQFQGMLVQQRLLDEIRSKNVPIGGLLPGELELADSLGIARPQIREGLRVLEAFGVVDGRQGSRRRWRGVDGAAWGEQLGELLGSASVDALAEFLEIRQTFETALLPQAVSNLTDDDLAAIRAIALDMVVEAQAGADFSALDEAFHRSLFAGLGNTMLLGLMSAYWRIYHSCTDAHPTDENKRALALQHLTIIDAIAAGDIRRGVHELDAHYYGVKARIDALRPEVSTSHPTAGGDAATNQGE